MQKEEKTVNKGITKTKIELVTNDVFLKETAISMKKNKKAFKVLAQ